MAAEGREKSGSRYLYEPFEIASVKLEAQERVSQERWIALERRLDGMEKVIERQERRLWLAVYGAATLFSADRLYQLFQNAG